jgi:hypothetical protein
MAEQRIRGFTKKYSVEVSIGIEIIDPDRL